ncbi:hypothetical protein COOONC_15141 [Cooperia oncophora]
MAWQAIRSFVRRRGSKFRRIPEGSTDRYTNWANGLSADQLTSQVFTSHGPTLIAPTWFISRELYRRLNGFREDVCLGYPEDLEFFYRALDLGNAVFEDHCRGCKETWLLAFCDVDDKKINRGVFEEYDDVARVVRWKLPIVHVRVNYVGSILLRKLGNDVWTERS